VGKSIDLPLGREETVGATDDLLLVETMISQYRAEISWQDLSAQVKNF